MLGPKNPDLAEKPAATQNAGAMPDHASDVDFPRVSDLKPRSARDLRLQKQLGAAAAVAVGAFLVLIYVPSATTLTSLHQQINADLRNLESDRARGRLLPELQSTAQRLEKELAGFKPLPAEHGLNELVRETSQLGVQLQLRAFRCEPYDAVVDGPLGTLPVRLTFEGNFQNVFSFVRRCEELERPVRVQEMKVRQKPAQSGALPEPGEVTVEMVLHVFYAAAPSGTGAEETARAAVD